MLVHGGVHLHVHVVVLGAGEGGESEEKESALHGKRLDHIPRWVDAAGKQLKT
jgi:hypothetical protein